MSGDYLLQLGSGSFVGRISYSYLMVPLEAVKVIQQHLPCSSNLGLLLAGVLYKGAFGQIGYGDE